MPGLDAAGKLIAAYEGTGKVGVWSASDWGRQGGWKTARAQAGTRKVNVGSFGDSILLGYCSSDWIKKGLFGALIASLQAEYGDGGSGTQSPSYATPGNEGAPADMPVCSGSGGTSGYGGWTAFASGLNTFSLYPHTAGSGVTYTAVVRGTTIEVILYPETSGTNTITWTIDGVAQTPINGTGAGTALLTTTVTGLAAGNHTVVLTASAGTPIINDVRAFNATGIVPYGMNKTGRYSGDVLTATNLSSAPTTGYCSIQQFDLDLFLYNLMVNDLVVNTTTALTYAKNIAVALDYAKAGNDLCDLVLIAPHRGSESDTNELYPSYVREMRAVAEAYGALFINFWAIGKNSWNYWSGLNYWGDDGFDGLPGSDPVHLDDAGYALMESEVYQLLVAA
jgi:lysophospholipase L1-like esterase